MVTERERFEVLLEQIRDEVRLLAEGQSATRRDIDNLRIDLHSMGDNLNRKIDYVHSSLKNEIKVTFMALDEKIEDHIKQPSHAT